jgi:two-component system OmpR family sensor kinase
MRQADQQLRADAARLVSRPFAASPLYGFAAGGPGATGSGGSLGIEVRGPGGRLVMRIGPAARTGPVIPVVPARTAAHAGQVVTVAAAGGGDSWRVIAEPIHYQVRRIAFSYSPEGFSVFVTSPARPGLAGTLVAGVDVAGIGHVVGGLAVTSLAVSGIALLAVACLGVVVIRALMRPLTAAQETLAAAAAGDLTRRVRDRHGGTDTGRLAWSLNTMLSRIEQGFTALGASEAAARRSSEQMSRVIAGTGHRLRESLSIIEGFAVSRRRGRSASELDHMMRRVTGEAARMDGPVDELLPAPRDRRQPPRL